MSKNKNRALKTALGQIEKQFGRGAIMRLADKNDALVAYRELLVA